MSQTYTRRSHSEELAQPSRSASQSQGMSNSAMLSGGTPSASAMGRSVSMPASLRQRMENSFGADFSGVRFFESQQVADNGADAVTLGGGNVGFAPGKLDFSSKQGQELIGHELAHVVSHARGEVTGHGFLGNASLEAQADRQGEMAAAGQSVYTGPVTPLSASTVASAEGPMQAKKNKKKDTPQAAAPVANQPVDPLVAFAGENARRIEALYDPNAGDDYNWDMMKNLRNLTELRKKNAEGGGPASIFDDTEESESIMNESMRLLAPKIHEVMGLSTDEADMDALGRGNFAKSKEHMGVMHAIQDIFKLSVGASPEKAAAETAKRDALFQSIGLQGGYQEYADKSRTLNFGYLKGYKNAGAELGLNNVGALTTEFSGTGGPARENTVDLANAPSAATGELIPELANTNIMKSSYGDVTMSPERQKQLVDHLNYYADSRAERRKGAVDFLNRHQNMGEKTSNQTFAYRSDEIGALAQGNDYDPTAENGDLIGMRKLYDKIKNPGANDSAEDISARKRFFAEQRAAQMDAEYRRQNPPTSPAPAAPKKKWYQFWK